MEGVTHVIHCAGLTKARSSAEFREGNQTGSSNVVAAANAQSGKVKRLVHISSLAALGPAEASKPAREDDSPQPVSEYGKSKLAGELEVRRNFRGESVVVRPPAVYGPRDSAFLPLFQAISKHILPRPSARQALSVVYVKDLAEAVMTLLEHPGAAGKCFFVASPHEVTAREMADEIASQIGHWTVPLPMSPALLWPVCLFREAWSQVTRKASLLNLQKFAELRAPGWVCDPSLLSRVTGFQCKTNLKEGIALSLDWYRRNRWL